MEWLRARDRGGRKERKRTSITIWSQISQAPAVVRGSSLANSFLQASTDASELLTGGNMVDKRQPQRNWELGKEKASYPPLTAFGHSDRSLRATCQPTPRRTAAPLSLLTHLVLGAKPHIFIQNTDRCPVLAFRLSEALLPPSLLHVPPTLWSLSERNVRACFD